ncbi:MAG: hypothetical protein C4294_20355, partial [Nitrospiraceae bacterium]
SVVERVIQDAFGIQKVWEKRPAASRLVEVRVSTLVQVREDSSNTPTQSLDALVALKGGRRRVGKQEMANVASNPVLLVGLSKTFHASYSPDQLAEMARMYWNLLSRFGNTSYPASPVLLAWVSLKTIPTVVGAWRIVHGSFETHDLRQSCRVIEDLVLRREFIGLQLDGKGNSYQGPQIIFPN